MSRRESKKSSKDKCLEEEFNVLRKDIDQDFAGASNIKMDSLGPNALLIDRILSCSIGKKIKHKDIARIVYISYQSLRSAKGRETLSVGFCS